DSNINPYYDPFINEIINSNNSTRLRRAVPASTTTSRPFQLQFGTRIYLFMITVVGSEVTDDQILSQSETDEKWHELLAPGPVAINLLGQLMILSSKLDFSFRDSAPDHKFVYIKYPQSFRATLVQISNGI
ncbi:unnamed protein product, partial [Didymodactylos carnosus]